MIYCLILVIYLTSNFIYLIKIIKNYNINTQKKLYFVHKMFKFKKKKLLNLIV